MKASCYGRCSAILLSLAFTPGVSASELSRPGLNEDRFAVIAGVHATPLVLILDNSQDEMYYPTLHSPLFYGASAAVRFRVTARIAVETGARYEILRSEGRTIERGVGIPLRVPIRLAGSNSHGFELIPDFSYHYVWSTVSDDAAESQELRLSGVGLQLAIAFRAEIVERLRLRFELGLRSEGGSFVNGHGAFADAGRGRASVPFGVSLEYGF